MAAIDSILLNRLSFGVQVKYMDQSYNSAECNHLSANTFNLFKTIIKYLFNTKIHLAYRLITHVNKSTKDWYAPQLKAAGHHVFTVPGYNSDRAVVLH